MNARRPDGLTESLRVRAFPGLCEGWGNCHRWAPAVYPLDAEGKIDVHLLEVPPELAVEAWMGAEACPAGVIQVIDVVVREGGHPEDGPTPARTMAAGSTPP